MFYNRSCVSHYSVAERYSSQSDRLLVSATWSIHVSESGTSCAGVNEWMIVSRCQEPCTDARQKNQRNSTATEFHFDLMSSQQSYKLRQYVASLHNNWLKHVIYQWFWVLTFWPKNSMPTIIEAQSSMLDIYCMLNYDLELDRWVFNELMHSREWLNGNLFPAGRRSVVPPELSLVWSRMTSLKPRLHDRANIELARPANI